MKAYPVKFALFVLLPLALAFSFWLSPAWMQLCYGLALFLFGMQNIEEGLQNAAGGTLERLMALSTATPAKGLLFGLGATFVLQSSTLVSLLTIAFLSAGLIGLAGGISLILGTNLGATSGIWLLALAGQSVSLSPAAIPMLIFGILAGFAKGKAKSVGRVLVGIALIFLGIDAIKNGFGTLGTGLDLAAVSVSGAGQVLMFCGIGLLLTIVLQSSHATLILTLAALAGGQIGLLQAFAIALGSNVGSSVSTALVGMLGGDRNGQRLALAHLLFNLVTALLALLLWLPLTRGVRSAGSWTGMNELLQLAMFHTVFNLLGLLVFWPLQAYLAGWLQRWLPDQSGRGLLKQEDGKTSHHAKYLHENMLKSGDTAVRAIWQEVGHLNALGLEIMCQAVFIPEHALYEPESALPPPEGDLHAAARERYETLIKPVYGELIEFAGKAEVGEEVYRRSLILAHTVAGQLVETVKDSKQLQKNMLHYLQQPWSAVYDDYLQLRQQLLALLHTYRHAVTHPPASPERTDGIALLAQQVEMLDTAYRTGVLNKLRDGQADSWQVTSLMNDINHLKRIGLGLLDILRADLVFPAETPQDAEL